MVWHGMIRYGALWHGTAYGCCNKPYGMLCHGIALRLINNMVWEWYDMV